MHRSINSRAPWVAFVAILAIRPATQAADPPAPEPSRGKQAAVQLRFGTDKRVPWSTSRVRGTPDPPLPYRAERVFPHVSFQNPTVITNAPGTERLFVGEQAGKAFSIPNDPECKSPDPFLDVADFVRRLSEKENRELDVEALYGLTFHPKFAENRYCYVCYVVQQRGTKKREQLPDGTRVSRLTVSRTDPPRCDPDSEQLVISWLQGGHNGGCLKFGPDGCLYISTGDGGFSFPPDGRNAGQDVTNLLSAILRIDVDRPDGNRPYTIPADNPFVSVPGAQGEIWAFGLRNPWKMSFDRGTGDLWVGDVGWQLWELVFRVRKGDNYGWSLYEGRQPVHVERQRGPAPIVPPTVEIPHTDGVSVTGGFVYRGRKLPELVGTYLFGDWETRRIWGVNADGPAVGPKRDLVEPTVRLVDFAETNDGELYLLDYDVGSIHAIARNPPVTSQHRFPRTLSETGLFENVAAHRVSDGVVPFSINAPLWSDHAAGERFLAVPGTDAIRIRAQARSVAGSMYARRVDYPADTVLMKTLSLEMQRGDAASRRRVETQLLHFDGRDWRGYTYQWNNEQTDATLVGPEGTSQTLSIRDPEAPGGRRQQTWKFASRNDCLRCHNPRTEFALAFSIPQINRDHDDGGVIGNQLRALRHIGLIEEDPGEPLAGEKKEEPLNLDSPESLPRYPNPLDRRGDLMARGRAYLHVHCGTCHRAGGGGSAYVHLTHEATGDAKALAVRPTQGTFGIPHALIVAPGDPWRSVLYLRMAKLGGGHMPHIGSSIVDREGLRLIRDWIAGLSAREDPPLLPRPAALDELVTRSEALTMPERTSRVDELLAMPATAAMLATAALDGTLPAPVQELAVGKAEQHSDAVVRDLFESFVPEERRVQRLGDAVRPEDLLKLAGDVERGRQLFHRTTGIQCRNCHRVGDEGTQLGPDLTRIGSKYDRAKLFENIADPSRSIDPQFVTWFVETKSGKVLTGLLVRKSKQEVVLKDAKNELIRIATEDVETIAPQQKSLMPDLLVRDLTAGQLADLLAYLESLK